MLFSSAVFIKRNKTVLRQQTEIFFLIA